MENSYSREYLILPSVCDSACLMGAGDVLALFMDMAH